MFAGQLCALSPCALCPGLSRLECCHYFQSACSVISPQHIVSGFAQKFEANVTAAVDVQSSLWWAGVGLGHLVALRVSFTF